MVAQLITYEALGLCEEGGAGKFIDAGDNTYGGRVVVNPSGGLVLCPLVRTPLASSGLVHRVTVFTVPVSLSLWLWNRSPKAIRWAQPAWRSVLKSVGSCEARLVRARCWVLELA